MMDTANDPAGVPVLTKEQWAGLARLGDLAHGLESFMGSPASALPMGLARKAGDWNERYALDENLRELLETLQSLREAGILRLLRENAAFLVESLRLLAPLLPQLLEDLKAFPIAELLRTVQKLAETAPKIQALFDFLQGPAGTELVSALRRIGDLWEETRADESLVALLRLLRRLQEDGNLQRLGDLSEQIGLLAETVDFPSLIGSLVQEGRESQLFDDMGVLLRLGRRLTQALAESIEHADQNDRHGGLVGLYRLLKDPEIQRGMRIAAALPTFVERAGATDTRNASRP
jgi:uncharacterized protein YjgD (DUF1641 family)